MPHAGVPRLFRDLTRLYRDTPALHQLDFEAERLRVDRLPRRRRVGAVLGALRARRQRSRGRAELHARAASELPAGRAGRRCYVERLNSDSRHYGGTDVGNRGVVTAEAIPANGQPASLLLVLPPLAGLVLARA